MAGIFWVLLKGFADTKRISTREFIKPTNFWNAYWMITMRETCVIRNFIAVLERLTRSVSNASPPLCIPLLQPR